MNSVQQPQPSFEGWPKMARLSRECIVTEKLDGSNGQICITEDGQIFAGSRTRWITPKEDNYGFARWVEGNKAELLKLGTGRHFGEWWGAGIQRTYGLREKRFSLFNTQRWLSCRPDRAHDCPGVFQKTEDGGAEGPACCYVVPILYRGEFNTHAIGGTLHHLKVMGSVAAPGFKSPEGIVIFHVAAGIGFKKTIEGDESPKGVPGLTDPAQLSAGKPAADAVFRTKVDARAWPVGEYPYHL